MNFFVIILFWQGLNASIGGPHLYTVSPAHFGKYVKCLNASIGKSHTDMNTSFEQYFRAQIFYFGVITHTDMDASFEKELAQRRKRVFVSKPVPICMSLLS
ncbi:MAG: hypothetical protein BA863_07505 [Desulfovibrio sp. S3730MH75]|nr:MAG: hypothetical protein BA863_07505 [Desulfovibrio sp. S3730MH75]